MLATTATGFAAMMALWELVKPKVFALYLAFAITGAGTMLRTDVLQRRMTNLWRAPHDLD